MRPTPLALLCLSIAACSDSSTNPAPDAPIADAPAAGGADAGLALRSFTKPADPGAKGVLLSVSGEAFANTGYDFPPTADDAVYFVDGWEIRYDRVLVTFDHVRLNENPDTDPNDQSKVGALVAQVDGPWAVDLHKGGDLDGKGSGPNEAQSFAAFTGKNAGGASGAFDPTVRYAFSFDGVPADPHAINVNLDAADLAEYQTMVDKGYTALFVGTATWKGGNACVTTGAYDFTKLPMTIHFHLGFKAPASYLNAQNPDNTGTADPGEESPRGIQVDASSSIVSQVTFHLDHAFWESFVHDSPAHFDTFAAKVAGASGTPTVEMEDYVGYGIQPIEDASNATVPWRFCPPALPGTQSGGLTLDTLSIHYDPHGDPSMDIRDFYDYTVYNHSTWGHLNADGLSFVQRHYTSPQ